MSGSLLIARRGIVSAAGFNPAAVANFAAGFDPSRVSGVVDGTAQGTLADFSGNSRDATQATGTKQPLFKTGILNGFPAWRFDGVDDQVTTPNFTLAQPFTAIVVCKFLDAYSNPADTIIAGGAAAINLTRSGQSTTLIWGGASTQSTAGAPDTQSFRVYTAEFNAASSKIWVDGTQRMSAVGSIGANNPGSIRFGTNSGGTEPGNLDLAYGLVYAGSLATVDRQYLERGLGTRFGLTVA